MSNRQDSQKFILGNLGFHVIHRVEPVYVNRIGFRIAGLLNFDAMICPACKYQSDAAETCPECGREFTTSWRLASDRRNFIKILIMCHVPWLVIGLVLLAAAIWDVNSMVLPWLKVYSIVMAGAIVLESLLVYFLLGKIDAASVVRDLLCLLVVGSGIVVAVVLMGGVCLINPLRWLY